MVILEVVCGALSCIVLNWEQFLIFNPPYLLYINNKGRLNGFAVLH